MTFKESSTLLSLVWPLGSMKYYYPLLQNVNDVFKFISIALKGILRLFGHLKAVGLQVVVVAGKYMVLVVAKKGHYSSTPQFQTTTTCEFAVYFSS